MALTISIEGLGELDNAEATTNWAITGSGGASFALDNEIFYQGSGSMNSKISSAKWAWLYYDHGSALNFNTTYAGQYVLIWFQITTPGSSLALNGTRPGWSIRMGSSTSNYREWALGGNDYTSNNYSGGWQCAVIDPTSAGTSDSGTYSASTVQFIGVQYSGNTASRAENLFIDSVMVGSGIRITGTETTSGAGWQEVVDYCVDRGTRAWGFVQEKEPGIFTVYGTLFVGDSTQTATTTLTDSGRVFKFGDYEYYSNKSTPTLSSAIGNSFHGLTVEDAASYTTTYQDGLLVGSDSGRSGSVFIGVDNADTTFDLYGGSNTSSTTKLYGTILNQIDGAITWGNDADHHMYSCTVTKSAQFDPVGAVVIRNCIFSETTSTTGAILWNSNIDIEDCKFIANTTGEGIEHDTVISVYSGTADDPGSSTTVLTDADATFTGGNVAVNDYVYNENDGCYAKVTVIDSATQLTHETLAGGTLNDWANGDSYSISPAVTYTDLLFSGNTSDVTNSASGNSGLFVSKAGTSDPVTATGNVVYIGAVTVKITVVDESNSPLENAQTTVILDSDNSLILNTDTNASGIATASFTGTTPASCQVKVRKSSSGTTRFFNSSQPGTIQSSTGLDIKILLRTDSIAAA